MLVLTRKVGERIVIGDNVEVQIVAIAKGRAKLGITAPVDVPIRRAEIVPDVAKATSTPDDAGGARDDMVQAC